MRLENIRFIETTPYTYQLNFVYDGNNLQTQNIDKATPQADVVVILQNVVNDFDARRAKSNYDSLKAAFEGRTVNI